MVICWAMAELRVARNGFPIVGAVLPVTYFPARFDYLRVKCCNRNRKPPSHGLTGLL